MTKQFTKTDISFQVGIDISHDIIEVHGYGCSDFSKKIHSHQYRFGSEGNDIEKVSEFIVGRLFEGRASVEDFEVKHFPCSK
jgi:Uri superfamily endonuclease